MGDNAWTAWIRQRWLDHIAENPEMELVPVAEETENCIRFPQFMDDENHWQGATWMLDDGRTVVQLDDSRRRTFGSPEEAWAWFMDEAAVWADAEDRY